MLQANTACWVTSLMYHEGLAIDCMPTPISIHMPQLCSLCTQRCIQYTPRLRSKNWKAESVFSAYFSLGGGECWGWTCFFICTMQCFPDRTFSKQTFQHSGSFSSRYRHEHGRISDCWHGPESILWIESVLPQGVKLMFAPWFPKLLELAKTCAT